MVKKMVTESIKLTEDKFYAHDDGLIIICDDWEQLTQQILNNQAKLEKITKYAKNLVYSNPHISWQLKQMLRDPPPKFKEDSTKTL